MWEDYPHHPELQAWLAEERTGPHAGGLPERTQHHYAVASPS